MTGGDPAERKVTLKYFQTTEYTNVTGVAQLFRGNGPFDPDATGAGGQPYNWDDFSVRYSQYYCTACRVKAVLQTNSSNLGEGLILASCPTNQTGSISIPDMISAPGGKFSVSAYGGQAKPVVMTMVARTSEVLGYKSREGYEVLSAVTGLPANQWYWRITVGTTTAVSTLDFTVYFEVEYDVVFVNRNSLTLDVLERKVALAQKRLAEAKEGHLGPLHVHRRAVNGELEGKVDESFVVVPLAQLPRGKSAPPTPAERKQR
jgi:hypothetical protein